MLKHTKVKLELLSDYDMVLMIEKGIMFLLLFFFIIIIMNRFLINYITGIRGGLMQGSMRYAKAAIILQQTLMKPSQNHG